MSSVRSSIETPAFTWRIFDWESMSLSRGISRDTLSARVAAGFIFGFDLAMINLRDGPAERLSFSL